MLKFARRRSSSTDRESLRKGGGGGDTILLMPRCRSSSEERTVAVVAPHAATVMCLESPATPRKVESNTANVKRLAQPSQKKEPQMLKAALGSATAAAMRMPSFAHPPSSVDCATMSPKPGRHLKETKVLPHEQQAHQTTMHCAKFAMHPPPPILPRKPKFDGLLSQAHHHPSSHLWKIELLDTSGESGYGTDSSDNNSLRSQESVPTSSPPPLPKRKPRRRVQFDSYVLLIQALKERDLRGILSTIFNVSAEALCTEDVIYHFHTAILRQDYEVTDLLVRAGCEVNTFDHRGWSALHCACSVARLDIIKLLLQNGAAVLARTRHSSQTGSQLLPPDNPAFTQCLAYLSCMEECLGTVNNRLVMAAANYQATRIDELTIFKSDRLVVVRRGDANNEMWWWVRNARREEGYVLRDLLALNTRHT